MSGPLGFGARLDMGACLPQAARCTLRLWHPTRDSICIIGRIPPNPSKVSALLRLHSHLLAPGSCTVTSLLRKQPGHRPLALITRVRATTWAAALYSCSSNNYQMSAPRLSRTASAHPRNVVTTAAARRSRSFLAGFLPAAAQATTSLPAPVPSSSISKSLTTLQEANVRNLPEVWFSPTFPHANTTPPLGRGPNRPPDDRKAKLGKSERRTCPGLCDRKLRACSY